MHKMQLGPSEEGIHKIRKKERLSHFCLGVLRDNPNLKNRVIDLFQEMEAAQMFLPFIHFTSSRIENRETGESFSPFLESIRANGLRKSADVVGFVKQNTHRLAKPSYYTKESRMEDFIKTVVFMIQNAWHHGVRVNKGVLHRGSESTSKTFGVPVALVIKRDNLRGITEESDHNTHFRFTNEVPPEDIIGEIDMSDERYGQLYTMRATSDNERFKAMQKLVYRFIDELLGVLEDYMSNRATPPELTDVIQATTDRIQQNEM